MVTALVLIVNSGDWISPAFVVTVAGTEASAGLLLFRLITDPPGGATVSSATRFPVDETPPTSDAGDNSNTVSAFGVTTIVSDLLMPLEVAVMVTVVGADTRDVVRLNE